MVNISQKMFKSKFFASFPKSTTQMGSLSVNISCFGILNVLLILKNWDINFLQAKYIMGHFKDILRGPQLF
jgi:hypothetical protein